MKLTEITAISPKEIAEQFCKKHKIEGATIHDNGIIDVSGDVMFNEVQFEQFPIKFGHVTGNFIIFKNNLLTSLKGCPTEVGKNFDIYGNSQLTSLEYGPIKVSGTIYQCGNCTNLKSFERVPPDFTGDFFGNECHKVKNLKGLPKKLKSLFIKNCTGLTSLEGIPEIITDEGLNINFCENLTSFDYLPKEITKSIIMMLGVDKIKNLLALFDIEGKFNLMHDNHNIKQIINKHLENPDREEGKVRCRQELKDNNYSEYARLK